MLLNSKVFCRQPTPGGAVTFSIASREGLGSRSKASATLAEAIFGLGLGARISGCPNPKTKQNGLGDNQNVNKKRQQKMN